MKTYQAKIIFKLAFLALLLWGALGAAVTLHAQGIAAGTSSITPNTQQIETGPVLDVVPYVLSDGYTINLTLIPSLTEFAGYDDAAADCRMSPAISTWCNCRSSCLILPSGRW